MLTKHNAAIAQVRVSTPADIPSLIWSKIDPLRGAHRCARLLAAVEWGGRNAMPLVADGKGKAVAHTELRATGFWMTVKGSAPVQPVRVFVSYEALTQLDPFDIRDLASAFEHFERFRARIEAAASDKFDRDGPDADKYEGMPAIRLTTEDPI